MALKGNKRSCTLSIDKHNCGVFLRGEIKCSCQVSASVTICIWESYWTGLPRCPFFSFKTSQQPLHPPTTIPLRLIFSLSPSMHHPYSERRENSPFNLFDNWYKLLPQTCIINIIAYCSRASLNWSYDVQKYTKIMCAFILQHYTTSEEVTTRAMTHQSVLEILKLLI